MRTNFIALIFCICPKVHSQNTLNLCCYLQEEEHISDVGGVLGLWLSCSCISLVELMEFLTTIALGKCKRVG